jgi:hypothetical protein
MLKKQHGNHSLPIFGGGDRKTEIYGDVVAYLVKSYKGVECNMS